MRLKRHYERNKTTGLLEPTRVSVIRAGKIQHLSPNFVNGGAAEGWLTMGGGYIAFGGIRYRIAATPGIYCCHCHLPQDSPEAAKAHLATRHKGIKSPDRQNPAGYRRDNFYRGVLA